MRLLKVEEHTYSIIYINDENYDVYRRFNAITCEENGYDRSKMVELIIKKFMDVKDGKVE
jgi:hypothetical protein